MLRLSLIAAALLLSQQAPAQTSGRSGKDIVDAVCINCHGSSASGAPLIGDRAAWTPRFSRGLDAAVASAINGHGNMPARGGMASLTDPEIRAAIVYMFNAGGVATNGAPARAPVPDAHRRIIHGTEILLGIASADALRAQHASTDPESTMHGGIPKGKGFYHVNVTLHDEASKAEIKDAKVRARVGTPLRGETKKLEPMAFNGRLSYGNYFRVRTRDKYTVALEIRLPGSPVPIETTFDFTP